VKKERKEESRWTLFDTYLIERIYHQYNNNNNNKNIYILMFRDDS